MLTSICDELERASRLTDRGQYVKARFILLDLSLRAELTQDETFKVQLASSKLAFARERYGEARRHLRIAERLQTDEAEIYYLWGRAYEFDPHGCDRRAARKYRKATILNASEPKYRAALGRALVRISNVRSGVKVLRRAAEAAPTDPEVLEIVREGLQEAEQAELALQILNKARFLAPGNRQVKHLWERARFDATAEIQKQNRKEMRTVRDERPAVIPFVRIHSETNIETNPDAKILRVRRDTPEQIQPRLAGLKAYRK
jgi:tetratricopeptide (TPR) repeat protein